MAIDVAGAVTREGASRKAGRRRRSHICAMFPKSAETDSIRGLRGEELRDALLARFRRQGWRERPLEVIVKADPGSIAAFRFNAASSRVRDLAPWPAGRITALGDAVHATPPTAGMGA
ncbi:FAD-dependent monooxygenase, partial [Nonomuraea deserti]